MLFIYKKVHITFFETLFHSLSRANITNNQMLHKIFIIFPIYSLIGIVVEHVGW